MTQTIPSREVTCEFNDDFLVLIQTMNPVIVCCVYWAPHNSPFRWTVPQLVILVSFLKKKQADFKVANIWVTGDINFVLTDWHTLTSCCKEEQVFFDDLASLSLEQQTKTKTRRFLTSSSPTSHN